MTASPRRFALLRHETKHDEHLDLMFNALDGDGGDGVDSTNNVRTNARTLATWRLLIVSLTEGASWEVACEPLPPHRQLYLTYEGPLTGERGCVKRVASGVFVGSLTAHSDWTVVLLPDVVSSDSLSRLLSGVVRFSATKNTMTYQPISAPFVFLLVRDRVSQPLDDAIAARWCPAVFPPLYDLAADDVRVDALRHLTTPLVVFSWLAPRAVRALLTFVRVDPELIARSVIVPLEPTTELESLVSVLDPLPRAHESEQALMDADAALMSPLVSPSTLPSRRWYPLVDESACVSCLECVNFCLFGVYDVGNSGKPLVVKPDACRDGCPACARVCPGAAILFAMHDEPLIAGRLDVAASQAAYRAAETSDESASRAVKEKASHTADPLDQLVRATDEMEL